MKKSIILIVAVMLSVTSFGQTKQVQIKDTDTVHIIITVSELKQILQIIEQNIDSKVTTKNVSDFLKAKAMLLQPAKKPHEVEPKN